MDYNRTRVTSVYVNIFLKFFIALYSETSEVRLDTFILPSILMDVCLTCVHLFFITFKA